MFKPDSWQSHDEYRTIVHSFVRRLSRNNPRYHFDLYSIEYQKLLNLDLDPLRDFIAGFFSPIGRPAIFFLIKLLPEPASLPGFVTSSHIPFPWLSSVVSLPQNISRLLVLITIS